MKVTALNGVGKESGGEESGGKEREEKGKTNAPARVLGG